MKTRTKLIWLELIGGVFGWVWIFASVAAIYFLVSAIGFHTTWSRLWWAVGIAALSKWLGRGFNDNKMRVAFEADLVAKGYSPADAGKEWARRYMQAP